MAYETFSASSRLPLRLKVNVPGFAGAPPVVSTAALPVAPPVAVLVQVTPVRSAGKLSVSVAPTAGLGPALRTTMVYVNGASAPYTNAPSVFVTDRSNDGLTLSVS